MPKVKPIIVPDENAPSGFSPNGDYSFICPGCGDYHVVNTKRRLANGAIWSFNDDMDKPTFTPSLHIKTGHFVTGQPLPPNCWLCNDPETKNFCYVCHCIVTNGQIYFCPDSTHKLAGQTVELPERE